MTGSCFALPFTALTIPIMLRTRKARLTSPRSELIIVARNPRPMSENTVRMIVLTTALTTPHAISVIARMRP